MNNYDSSSRKHASVLIYIGVVGFFVSAFLGLGKRVDLNSGSLMHRDVITVFQLPIVPLTSYDGNESMFIKKIGISLPNGEWHEIRYRYFFWGDSVGVAYSAPYSNVITKALNIYESDPQKITEVSADLHELIVSESDVRRATLLEKYK